MRKGVKKTGKCFIYYCLKYEKETGNIDIT